MTSKFSLRGTRVQPKPRVCKSPKKRPPTGPPQPASAESQLAWNWFKTAPGQPPLSQFQDTIEWTTPAAPGQPWTHDGTDVQGQNWHADFTVGDVATEATVHIVVQISDGSELTLTGTAPGWDGSSPFHTGTRVLTLSAQFGSGSWSWGTPAT